MNDVLYVPLKRSSDIDVSKPLKNLISSTYSSADSPANVSEQLGDFQKLRQNSVRGAAAGEKGEAFANATAK